ncbi:MAG: VOC family protein [Patescibacteria group bacterium]|nr:VOC family protein [Patescibacteria group bacterium]
MHIEHVAVYVTDLERLRAFYERYFGVEASAKYVNEAKQFASYFLRFPNGARLEIMSKASVVATPFAPGAERPGWIHVAISVGSEQQVDALTATLAKDGYTVLDGPRWTGDGCYESAVLDPEGNRLELTP